MILMNRSYEINTLDKFKKDYVNQVIIIGDHFLIQLIMETFKVNLLILTQNLFTEHMKSIL